MKSKKDKKSKTNTIKQRLIYVYLPSEEMVNQWKGLAGKSKISISRFVIEHVNNSVQQEQDSESYKSRLQLLDSVKKLTDENKELNKKVKMQNTLIDRLEKELREYRAKPFFKNDFLGYRKYELDLIRLFKTRLEVRKDEILDFLDVSPLDTDIVKGIMQQIENLEQYGFLKDIGGKWRWKP